MVEKSPQPKLDSRGPSKSPQERILGEQMWTDTPLMNHQRLHSGERHRPGGRRVRRSSVITEIFTDTAGFTSLMSSNPTRVLSREGEER